MESLNSWYWRNQTKCRAFLRHLPLNMQFFFFWGFFQLLWGIYIIILSPRKWIRIIQWNNGDGMMEMEYFNPSISVDGNLGWWIIRTTQPDIIYTWNSKQPVRYGCFNWMIKNLYMGNGCLTKHPFKNWLFAVPGVYIYMFLLSSHQMIISTWPILTTYLWTTSNPPMCPGPWTCNQLIPLPVILS